MLRFARQLVLPCLLFGVCLAAGPAFVDDAYCTGQQLTADEQGHGEISTHAMDCLNMMELVYISRRKVLEELENHQKEASATRQAIAAGAAAPPWRQSLRVTSRASSLLSAQVHIVAAIETQKPECFSEHFRLLLIVGLRRLKAMVTGQLQMLWLVGQESHHDVDSKLAAMLEEWLLEATSVLDMDLKTMRSVLETWKVPEPHEVRFYSHEADGRYSTMESLRRETFEEWQLDKGLLQFLLRHVLPIDASVADFGAGSGHYSRWLNDTGLVSAFAFDGSPDISLVTRGAVAQVDLGKPLSLWRKFDWGLCLEVGEHIPAELTPTFLSNLDAHVTEGLVISWAQPGLQALGSTNPQTESQVLSLLQAHTSLYLDQELTMKLRAASRLVQLTGNLLVMVRKRPGSVTDASVLAAPGCQAEEGVIYAGSDVQTFSAVDSAAKCCELCSTNDNCRYWTWSREDSHKEMCWIKATKEYRISHSGFVSGSRDTSA